MSKKDKICSNSVSLLKLNVIDPEPFGLRLKSNDLLNIFSNFFAICLSSIVKGFSTRVVFGLKANFSPRANSSTCRTDN
jgi:hypothetical protein